MFVEVNGISTYVESRGHGYPVVLIHALGTNLRSWDPVATVLERGYSLVGYDYRGHGRSEKTSAAISIPLLAQDLRALLGVLGLERAHLVGLAVGAMIAQQVAVDYPGLASGLVLADTRSGIDAPAAQFNEQRADSVERGGMRAAVDSTIARAFAPDFSRRKPEALRAFRGEFLANDPHGYAAVSRALSSFRVTDRLAKIDCPTLLLTGELDKLCPPSEAAAIQTRIAGAKLEILPGVGHFSAIEAPEVFAERALAFLDSIGTREATQP
ncbi:MAG TPA: alpha/beta fold hydrolase [Candidatus Methylomirabilis sp.]|nr:alpha/beta fold hydrolase [Candidatus Methylomirabilis sp.]